jgi:hypothetical protein
MSFVSGGLGNREIDWGRVVLLINSAVIVVELSWRGRSSFPGIVVLRTSGSSTSCDCGEGESELSMAKISVPWSKLSS